MLVGPDDVGIKPVDQISPPHIALELNRAVDRRELVLDLYVFVVHHTFQGSIPYTVRLRECEVEFHLPGVSEPAMLGMKRERDVVEGMIRWH